MSDSTLVFRPRLYLDTSVIGGCFDAEFAAHSRALIQRAIDGEIVLIVSDLLVRELQDAPPAVRSLYTSLPAAALEPFVTNEEAERLQAAYLATGIVGPKWSDDAQHVANATVASASALISWNFRHIVHGDKMRGYNAVNLRVGYPALKILSPKEVR
jgi:hypothetical protein